MKNKGALDDMLSRIQCLPPKEMVQARILLGAQKVPPSFDGARLRVVNDIRIIVHEQEDYWNFLEILQK